MIQQLSFKKSLSLISVLSVLIFSTLLISITLVSAQSDLTMVLGDTISNSNIDGEIRGEWDDAASYNNVDISPTGTAQIWLKHDQTYLYIAVEFEADSNNPWVSLQLGNPDCMTSNTDGAIFGHDDHSANGYQDIYFGGFGVIYADNSQDGTGAMDLLMNTVTIELKKPLNSQDSDGRDVQWTEDNSYDIIVMWDSDGGGSSGGSTSHTSNNPQPYTIYLEPQTTPTPTPQPMSLDLTTILAIVAVVVIILVIIIYLMKVKK